MKSMAASRIPCPVSAVCGCYPAKAVGMVWNPTHRRSLERPKLGPIGDTISCKLLAIRHFRPSPFVARFLGGLERVVPYQGCYETPREL